MRKKIQEPAIYMVYYSTHSMTGVSTPFLSRSKTEIKRYLESLLKHSYKPTVYLTVYNDQLLVLHESNITGFKGEEIEWLN